MELLPNAHVTFLIDTHQNHVAQYGKRRVPIVAEIMDDPWGELISAHSSTVVYYLRPDPTAMSHQLGLGREKKEGAELGMLTDCFVSALINCYKRYQVVVCVWKNVHYHNIRFDSELSHRHIYEAVSLYWHRNGREHNLFVPAIQVRGTFFHCHPVFISASWFVQRVCGVVLRSCCSIDGM